MLLIPLSKEEEDVYIFVGTEYNIPTTTQHKQRR